MARRLTANQVKVRFASLLRGVAPSEEIEITLEGVTVARLMPARRSDGLMGQFRGVARNTSSDEDLYSTGSWSSG
jgi:antitoxin (DNA-binding transcriptional repressor) of toxin-antitoxin stability system